MKQRLQLTFIFCSIFLTKTWSQALNKPTMDQMKFTDRMINIRNMISPNTDNCWEIYLNNTKLVYGPNLRYVFFYSPGPSSRGGVYHAEVPFGLLKPGDVLFAKDICSNEQTDPVIIRDDFVYVDVPASSSQSGNGINGNSTFSPYNNLSTPVNVGKCEALKINAHILVPINITPPNPTPGTSATSGIFKINGQSISNYTFESDFGGENTHYTINPNGSITNDNHLELTSHQHFSGNVPLTFEYTANGIPNSIDFVMRVGGMQLKFIKNESVYVNKRNYLGDTDTEILYGDFSHSNFKINFDQNYYVLYIDGVERSRLARFVVYNATGGTLSNTSSVPYRTEVTYTPNTSGIQTLTALIDGAVYAFQKFNVAEDISLNQTVTNVACNGQSTGSVTINATGGQNPLQYSKDGVSFSNNSTFSSLAAGNYTFYVKDASGCQTSKGISVSENSALGISISSKTNANCDGQANGSATLAATGGAGFYEFGYEDAHYQSGTTISNLVSGNYQFWVKDAAGCKKSIDDVIGLNSSLKANILSKQNLLCFNDNTGNITLENTGAASGTVKYSKDGLIFQTSPTFSSLASGNYTFTLKDDICSSSIATNISEPTPLSLTGNIDNQVSCFGGSNAKITVTENGGTSPYTFSSDDTNFGSSKVFDNLPIGNYKYWVKDQNDCKANTSIFTITQPTDIVFSVSSKTDISCFGGNDGVVNLAASGGVSNFQYSIDNVNFVSSNSFTGLNFGLKTFTVKDQNSCQKTLQTTLLQPTLFELAVSLSKNLVCNSDNTGSVTLNGTGGTTPYTFYKNSAADQSSPTFSGLAATSYVFSAKDAKNCEVVLPAITLTQPTPIAISHTLKTDVNCENYATGALSFLAAGSNGGFTYTLNGTTLSGNSISPLNSNSGDFTNLKPGNYILTATDQLACKKDYSASIISKNSGIRFDLSSTMPSSCLASDGNITISNIRGGRPNPSYNIKLAGQNTFGSQTTFNNLINGNYIVTVADDLCSFNQEVSLKLASSINASYAISPLSCTSPNANVNVDPISGGSGNYQLAINGGAFSANRNFSNLTPNTYSVVIKDSPLTCQTALSFEIKEQNRADLKTSQVKNISCFEGSDGFIQAIGDNNLSPFTYSFNNLSNFSSNNNFGGLPIGTYKIYAKNSIGCLDSIKVGLSQPTKILWDVSTKNNDCFGDQTGAISISGNGGTPPYQYAISNTFVANHNFDKLFAGKYNTAIKDKNGCQFGKVVEVMQPTELKINPVYKDTITCFGEKNGSILIEANGGTPGYTFAMDNENVYDVTDTFKNLGVGKYAFFVRDSKQCLKQTELLITEPERLDLSLIGQTDPLCIGEKNGTITLLAKGGNNGGYTYTMDNSLKQFNNGLFKNLSEGDFTFKVEDRKACFDTVTLVKLKWPKALSASMSQKQPVCFGDANGQILIEANGGVGGFTAEMVNQNNLLFDKTQPVENSFTFSKLPAGLYQFAVKDRNGCQLSLVEQMEDAVKIEDFHLPKDTTVCKEQIVKFNVGNKENKIQWYFNDSELTSGNQNSQVGSVLIVSKPGIYKVDVSNATGCKISKSFELKNNNQALIADFLMTIQAFEGDTVYALDISKPTPDEILWTLPSEALKINQNTDGMTFQIDTEGTYTIEMLAKKGECQNIKIREIEIFKKEDIEKTSGELFYNAYDIFKSLNVFPNPNYGKFDVDVKLSKTADIEIVITRASNGVLIYKEGFTGKADYKIPIVLKNFIQDNYLLTVKVGNVVMVKRILLMN